jgi:hypothetical protein
MIADGLQLGERVYITMCWSGKGWNDHVNPHNYPVITCGKPSLGIFMFHECGRDENDPQWTVGTIGL